MKAPHKPWVVAHGKGVMERPVAWPGFKGEGSAMKMFGSEQRLRQEPACAQISLFRCQELHHSEGCSGEDVGRRAGESPGEWGGSISATPIPGRWNTSASIRLSLPLAARNPQNPLLCTLVACPSSLPVPCLRSGPEEGSKACSGARRPGASLTRALWHRPQTPQSTKLLELR